MITILHGENIVASRARLIELRKQKAVQEVVTFASPPQLTDLIQALESKSLFGGERLVILENLLSRMGRKRKDDLVEYLQRGNFATDCILWESKTISPSVLTPFPKGIKVEIFKLHSTLFRFLESLRPGSSQESLRLFHESLRRDEVELLFAMLTRQVRFLMLVKIQAFQLAEVQRLAPWQRGKFQAQSRFFTEERLIKLYRELYRLDRDNKSGRLVLPLPATLDILLAEI